MITGVIVVSTEVRLVLIHSQGRPVSDNTPACIQPPHHFQLLMQTLPQVITYIQYRE